ncbi:glycoside hydrolase [Rhizoclosmatium globosum]|uniref:Glycoside hydrolase n=1 Tax=Rhizoclosmatium globosum TaxID=329046 RepID=A0A1Y2CFY9_9FUNG|nr:glycoside hydrolase [Rhizoclosmatium globosum]|eukprot:ORY45942.1 glycoside hydrolase [Rhizoclosmatium globosum]
MVPLRIAAVLVTATTVLGAIIAPSVPIYDANKKPLASCARDPNSALARLEPPLQNKLMLGVSLDWSYEVPSANVKKQNGYTPAVYNAWLDIIPGTFGGLGYDNNTFNWFGSEAGRVGAMLELSLNPQVADVSKITVEMMTNFAKMCAFINEYYGVPIFLRYAHEMNGDWYPWGNWPTQYIASHRQFTFIVRQYTNMTAMVWAPNIGITYPFVGGGARESPLPGGLDFNVLDTNGDGKIDNMDDPYTPFYPGDDVVDWVGLSLYYYPICQNNCAVPANFFDQLLTGVNNPNSPGGNLQDAWLKVHNFYQMFAVGRNKPMMLPETGSPWIPTFANATGATSEVQVKDGWWKQLISQATLQNYPKLKLFVQFEEVKPLALNGVPAIQDWRVTNNTATLTWWNGFIDSVKSTLVDADGLVYKCDGSVVLGTKIARDTVVPTTAAVPSQGGNAQITQSQKSGSLGTVVAVVSLLSLLSLVL